MKNNNDLIFVGIFILVVLALILGPKLGLFSIIPSNAIIVSEDTYVEINDETDNHGSEDSFAVDNDEDRRNNDLTWSYLKFVIDDETFNLIKAGVNISSVNLYLYPTYSHEVVISFYETSNNWNEQTLTWVNKPPVSNLITTKRIYSSDEDSYVEIIDFESYFQKKIRNGENEISFVIKVAEDSNPYQEFDSKDEDYKPNPPYILVELEQEYICTENEIKQFDEEYFICRDTEWSLVLDLIELTDEEQQAFLDQINLLSLTIEQKIELINNLTSTLDGQLLMITNLETTISEKAIIINQLELNIEEQNYLISQMELNVNEQVEIINELNLTISNQAELINELTTNLEIKSYLISQLQVENENQAELIYLMNLSFSDQAGIISDLENTISDDAEIIINLYSNIEDQTQLILELELSKSELSELIYSMNLTLQENAELISNLKLTTQEQIEIINNLKLSIEDERDLVNQLRDTIEEQNALIDELNKQKEPTFDLKEFWEEYMLWIILVGLVLLILVVGGKKR